MENDERLSVVERQRCGTSVCLCEFFVLGNRRKRERDKNPSNVSKRGKKEWGKWHVVPRNSSTCARPLVFPFLSNKNRYSMKEGNDEGGRGGEGGGGERETQSTKPVRGTHYHFYEIT